MLGAGTSPNSDRRRLGPFGHLLASRALNCFVWILLCWYEASRRQFYTLLMIIEGLRADTFLSSSLANIIPVSNGATETYVCNLSDCDTLLPANSIYYPTISTALGALQANLSTLEPPFIFWLVPGFIGDIPSFNTSLKQVELINYPVTKDSSDVAVIGGVNIFGSGNNFTLKLEAIRIVSFVSGACVMLKSSDALELVVSNSSVSCPTLVTGGTGSRVNLTGSRFESSLKVDLGEKSFLYLADGSFAAMNATTTRNSSVLFWSNWFSEEIFVWTEFNRFFATDNGFLRGAQLMTYYSSLHLWDNWFMAQDELKKFNASLSSNLAIAIRCRAHFVIEENIFFNGTFHISDVSDKNCDLSISEHSSLKNNTFSKPHIEFSAAYDVLRFPAQFAISVSTGLHNALARDHQEFSLLIDATGNYWGDPSGPYLCCNEKGTGAYASLFIDTSNWCLDPLCNATSNISLPRECVTQGCFQTLSKTEIIIFWTSFAVCLAVLISCISFNIYHNARHFNLGSFHKYSQEHLLTKAHVQWRVGMIASTLASLLAMANVLVPLVSTLHTKASTHQHIIPFRAFAILCMYVAIASLQILANTAGYIASVVQWKYFSYIAKPLYVWNIVNVALTTTVTLGWIPTGGFVDLLANYFITETSGLINLLYVSTVLICLISIGAFIPVRLMNDLVFHYDVAKIRAALETALLKELMRSPAVEKRAKLLRYATVVSFFVGLVPMVTTIYDVTVDHYFKTRLITSTIQHLLGLSCLGGTFAVTFYYYNQDVVLTIISIVMCTVTVACLQDLIFWAYYLAVAVNSVYSRGYVILQIAASLAWMIALIVSHLLVHYLKLIVARELPLHSIDNLNQHIDETMNDKPIGGIAREKIPLLFTTDSEVDTPRTTASSTYDSRGSMPGSGIFSW